MRALAPDSRRLLEFVGELHSFDGLQDFRPGLIELLGRALPSDWIAYNEVNPDPADTTVLVVPELSEAQLATFAGLAHENPILAEIRRTGDGRPRRFSDLIDRRALHRLALYRKFYGPLGVESQVAFTLPAEPPCVIGIAMCRGPEDYSDEDIAFLALARPHMIQAFRNALLVSARARALAALEQQLDVLGQHVLMLDARGRVASMTPGARRILGELEIAPTQLADELPRWRAARAADRARSLPLIVDSPRGVLVVRPLPPGPGGDPDVLVIEGTAGPLGLEALAGLGLTPRQAETLLSTALGCSAAETAQMLGISRRTVDKHLQAIYAKLGVRSRPEAAAAAWAQAGIES